MLGLPSSAVDPTATPGARPNPPSGHESPGRTMLGSLEATTSTASAATPPASDFIEGGHNPCTSDAQCNDNNVCNGVETCEDFCIPGAPLNCDDGNVCTTDSCNPTSGCATAPNTVPCDDGNPCTSGDVCSGGVCSGTAGPGAVTGLLAVSKTLFDWDPVAGASITYDVARGLVGEWPPGSGAGESCLALDDPATSVTDLDALPAGAGYWYLVRSRGACGIGSYGDGRSGISVCQ